MKQPKYRIYPSLLDKYTTYLRADEEAESYFNIDSETGEYKKSPQEIEDELKRSLIDAINRVPFSSEAADKGTAFNALIDMAVHCRKHVPTEREPYTIVGDRETNMVQVAFPATDISPERTSFSTENGYSNRLNTSKARSVSCLYLLSYRQNTVMWSYTDT